MKKPIIPANEDARLQALHILRILDTEPEQRFDSVTRLATKLFDVPIALVSLVDEDRQWFKSKVGLRACETSRDISFCGHSINEENYLIVEDASSDMRFFDNPLVTGGLGIRFYAGKVLRDPQGYPLGTLCIIDRVAHQFSQDNLNCLNDLGCIIERELLALRVAKLDCLTQVLNRMGFVSESEKLLRSSNCTKVRAFYFDLDDFKSLNDIGGHELGDLALKVFADALYKSFGSKSLIGRLGGDEFMVISDPALCGEDSALDLIRKLNHHLETHPLQNGSHVLCYSHGVVDIPLTDQIAFDDILKVADRAMYECKNSRKSKRT